MNCPTGCSECFYAVFTNGSPPKENYTMVDNFTLLTDAEASSMGLKKLCGDCEPKFTIYVDLATCMACPSTCTECFYSNGREINMMQIYLSISIPASNQLVQKGVTLRCSDCLEGYSLNLSQVCIKYNCALKNCSVCMMQQTPTNPKTTYYSCLKCTTGYSIFTYENQSTIPPQRISVCKNCADFFDYCLQCQSALTQSTITGGPGGAPGGGGGGGGAPTIQYVCTACESEKVLSSVNYETKCLSCDSCASGMCTANSITGKVSKILI
jgi:hypothetical protein